MKITHCALRFAFCAYLSLLFCWTFTFAQYPKDERINPYPKPVKERVLVQRFDCNAATVSQWKALNHSVISATSDSIRVVSSGHDPYIQMPGIQSPQPATFEFRIGMKNTMQPAAEVFWGTTRRPGSHPDFSVRFGFLPDGQSHAYAATFTTEEPLSDSFTLTTQHRNPADINPSVLAMQRLRLQGEPSGVDVALCQDGKYRVVSPFQTSIETSTDGKTFAVIEAKAGVTYQILVNDRVAGRNAPEIKTIESQGRDRIELTK